MSNQNPNRIAAGVPAGGRFAPSSHSEPNVALPASPEEPSTPSEGLAALMAEIRSDAAKRTAALEEMGAEAERTGNSYDYDEARADMNEDAVYNLQRLLDALERSGFDGRTGSSGAVAYNGSETRVEGGFGEVIVSPRDPDSGPGTIVMVDTSGQKDGQPVKVMINDEVYDVPVEADDNFPESERCADCGRHVDACVCADREIDPDTSSVAEITDALAYAYDDSARGIAGADRVADRLAGLGVARIVRDADQDAHTLDLDWGPSGGLEPVAARDAFGDERGPLSDEQVADLMPITTSLRPDSGLIRPTGSASAPYRIDLDEALGKAVW